LYLYSINAFCGVNIIESLIHALLLLFMRHCQMSADIGSKDNYDTLYCDCELT
jgi:hypothetical protein